MSEDAETEWLPPQAPGAAPPRRWESVPDVPEAPSQPWAPPQQGAPQAAPVDWWRQDAGGRPAPAHLAPASAGRVAAAPGSGAALASLILGIAGLVLFFFAGFGLLFVLNLPCSILAWIFGVQARRKLDGAGSTERRGMAQAGIALGVVGTVVGGLAIIGWALGFAFSDELRDDFQRRWDEAQRNR